ncbi:uncharacterized protein [Hoplias malabaricus]|uniref:uncharacterized protein isoform X2 n=1 Tax=Hoplias malabaricus TaxID=27720 RepID=UPI0034636BCA
MESSGLLSVLLFITFFTFICSGQLSPDISTEERSSDPATEQELIEAMEELLGRFQENQPSTEKRSLPRAMSGGFSLCDEGGSALWSAV